MNTIYPLDFDWLASGRIHRHPVLVRRPGRRRGKRLIDLRSLDEFIESGIGGKSDMGALSRPQGKETNEFPASRASAKEDS